MKLVNYDFGKLGAELLFVDADHAYRVFVPNNPAETITYSTKVDLDWRGAEHWRNLPSGPKRDELKKLVAAFVSFAERLVELLKLRGGI